MKWNVGNMKLYEGTLKLEGHKLEGHVKYTTKSM